MNSYRIVLVSFIAGIVIVATIVHALRDGMRPRFNRTMFDRLELGMTADDVVDTLGASAGDYTTYEHIVMIDTWDQDCERWISNEGAILIRFGPDRRVDSKFYRDVVCIDAWHVLWHRLSNMFVWNDGKRPLSDSATPPGSVY